MQNECNNESKQDIYVFVVDAKILCFYYVEF